MLRYVMTIVVIVTLLIGQPGAAVTPGYNYAGQRTGIVVTGIWTYIQTASLTITTNGSQVAHWIGKANGPVTQWQQTGWIQNCSWGCSTPWYYLEYVDYAGSYSGIIRGYGVASGTQEFAVWGDATGGSDGIGPYFNNFVNLKSGPNNISPTWTTRLTDLWHPNTDAVGEAYNATTFREDIGDAHFGLAPAGFEFLDLAAYDGSGTIWSLWDTRTQPVFFNDYSYSAFVAWYHFRIWR